MAIRIIRFFLPEVPIISLEYHTTESVLSNWNISDNNNSDHSYGNRNSNITCMSVTVNRPNIPFNLLLLLAIYD